MRIVHHDLVGAACDRPVDSGIDLSERETTSQLVGGTSGWATLRPVDDAGHTFHIEEDEDLHELLPATKCPLHAPMKRCARRLKAGGRPTRGSGGLTMCGALRGTFHTSQHSVGYKRGMDELLAVAATWSRIATMTHSTAVRKFSGSSNS